MAEEMVSVEYITNKFVQLCKKELDIQQQLSQVESEVDNFMFNYGRLLRTAGLICVEPNWDDDRISQ